MFNQNKPYRASNQLVYKYAVRAYVEEKIGAQNLNEAYIEM